MYTRNDTLAVLKAGFKHELVTSLPSVSQDTETYCCYSGLLQSKILVLRRRTQNLAGLTGQKAVSWRVPRYQGLGGWFTWIHNRTWGTSWSKGKLSTFFYLYCIQLSRVFTNQQHFCCDTRGNGPHPCSRTATWLPGLPGWLPDGIEWRLVLPESVLDGPLGKAGVLTSNLSHSSATTYLRTCGRAVFLGEIARIWGTPVLRNYHVINSELITPWFEPSINFQIHHWDKNNPLTLRLLVPKVS